MSTTETEQPEGPRVTRDQVKDLGRLVRTSSASPENRYLGGVAGGIARHLDIDPIIVRIAFVVTVFFGGAGILVYAAGWLFMPDERDGRAVITVDARSRSLALWVALGIAVLALVGDVAGGFRFPWWIIPTLVIILIAVRWWERRHATPEDRIAGETAVADALARARATTHEAIAKAQAGADTATAAALTRTQAKTEAALTRAQARTEAALAKAQARVERRQTRRLKNGPLLFWFTLALIALAEGVLGVTDGAGADIAPPAYPALALGIIGLMLVLGAFWGRAGGLILIGLVTAVILGLSSAAHEWGVNGHGEHVRLQPTSAALVDPSPSFDTGELTLDLTRVADPAALDGKVIEVSGKVGRIHVIVPRNLTVEANGHVGVGGLDAWGQRGGGFDNSLTAHQNPGDSVATVTIDADLHVGQIEFDTEDD